MPLKRTLGFGHSCILRLAGAFSAPAVRTAALGAKAAAPAALPARRARQRTPRTPHASPAPPVPAAVPPAAPASLASTTVLPPVPPCAFPWRPCWPCRFCPWCPVRPDAAEGDVLVVALDMGHGQAPWKLLTTRALRATASVEATAVTDIAQACADELSHLRGREGGVHRPLRVAQGARPVRGRSGRRRGDQLPLQFRGRGFGQRERGCGSTTTVPTATKRMRRARGLAPAS